MTKIFAAARCAGFLLGLLAMTLTGCNSQSMPTGAFRRTPLIDQIAGSEQYRGQLASADKDLPGDEWSKPPLRDNLSRYRRVKPIAQKICFDLRGKLATMSVDELMRCLKVDDGTGFRSGYIADALYPDANGIIIAEIASRPESERQALVPCFQDGSYLYTGSNGESRTIGEVARQLAPEKPKTAGAGSDLWGQNRLLIRLKYVGFFSSRFSHPILSLTPMSYRALYGKVFEEEKVWSDTVPATLCIAVSPWP